MKHQVLSRGLPLVFAVLRKPSRQRMGTKGTKGNPKEGKGGREQA